MAKKKKEVVVLDKEQQEAVNEEIKKITSPENVDVLEEELKKENGIATEEAKTVEEFSEDDFKEVMDIKKEFEEITEGVSNLSQETDKDVLEKSVAEQIEKIDELEEKLKGNIKKLGGNPRHKARLNPIITNLWNGVSYT